VQTIQILGTLFNEKRKKQFIPLPWKIGEIFVKNISHLDEFTTQFDHFNLEEVHAIKVSTLMIYFQHTCFQLDTVHHSISYVQLEEGGGDNQNPLEVPPETTLDDIDTLVNTNDHYKKYG
jgi:hypothetical protein